ncbi:putative D-aminoacylase [Chaetomium tenue]|uniref:D-aminoacylase n=1 Tax=Chaetomium tenue TaxID=1854479 RepID=A0ACB7PIN6_9PEZI|nr:putative D-aminoacylase [Chaetomium globosum]
MALSSILAAVEPTILEICEASGVAGLSYGISHAGENYFGNFGFRNVLEKLPPNEETIYHLGSLTKFFTAAMVGILVEKGQLDWTTPVREILPEFETPGSPTTGAELTLLDLLYHRTGWAQKLDIWLQGSNRLLIPKEDTIRTCGYLEQYQYNNWGYCLAGEVIERAAGKSYGSLNPSNMAEAYMPLDDKTPWHVPRPEIQDGTLMGSAGGLRSCVKDLLKVYENLLLATKHQFAENASSAPQSPFKQLQTIMTGHMPISNATPRENTYALGWARTQLPGPLGATGLNGMFVSEMPTSKAGSKSRLVLHHQGSMPGFTSAAFLFSETGTTLVVLSNSLPLNDAVDWIGQLLIESIFETEGGADSVKLAKESAEAHIQYCKEVGLELEALKNSGTPTSRPFEGYGGHYYNSIGNLCLQIKFEEGKLSLLFQGLLSEAYALHHLDSDTFHWHIHYNEDVRRARFTVMDANFYQIKFIATTGGAIDQLIWAHEPDIPEGEVFTKRKLNGL